MFSKEKAANLSVLTMKFRDLILLGAFFSILLCSAKKRKESSWRKDLREIIEGVAQLKADHNEMLALIKSLRHNKFGVDGRRRVDQRHSSAKKDEMETLDDMWLSAVKLIKKKDDGREKRKKKESMSAMRKVKNRKGKKRKDNRIGAAA